MGSPAANDARPEVLVADDDPIIRRLVGTALADAGFGVAEAADGAEAFDLAASRPFSVVLLDGRMPRLSGREVLERLRSRPETTTLPVILVTADGAVSDRVSGLAAGADDYIVKPFSTDEVVARVRAQLRVRDAWNDTLASHARQRSELARALAAAGSQPTLEAAAHVLCTAVTGQADVVSAVLVRFTADQLVVPIACCGTPLWGLAAGDPAPQSLRRYLTSRAAAGPWLECGDSTASRPPAAIGSSTVACAPVVDEGRPIALLLVGLAAGGAAGSADALSAAIDFAAVAQGLLRTRLLEYREAEADRMTLRSLLQGDAFVPWFQPIVCLASGEMIGVEALTRFSDGSNTETRFREAAAAGVGLDLEMATLRAAMDEARQSLPPDKWLSLNVSPALVLDGEDALREVIDLRDHHVVLELSEQEAVSDYDGIRSGISSLGSDVRLSIDDAGSGFASLRHILKLEPAFVKLDRSWVHGLDCDSARQAMIAGLRHFSDQIGAELIAEGIEREEERKTLVDLGVDHGQGYLLGRPSAVTCPA